MTFVALSSHCSHSMHVTLHYLEEVPTTLTESFLKQVAEETLKRFPSTILEKKTVSLNAVAVSEAKIQELNRTYGGKDKVTDILSFGEYPDRGSLEHDTNQEIFLGEIFFCYEYIVVGAREDAVTTTHEMTYVFSHGVLHLLGYDHEEEMFAIQDKVTEFLMQSQEKE